MANHTQAVRGMNDLLPEQLAHWHTIEKTLIQIASSYAYQEIRFPIVESTDLFKRTIGEATDIVEKEMYTFTDRNGDSLTLRPEGTAGCVRAGIQQGLLYNQIQRLWYTGPMFRHERPQKGRYRQFYQFGVEAFGMPSPRIDAEIILVSARIWQALKLSDKVHLQLNTLGSLESRKQYREHLISYLEQHKSLLDESSLNRLYSNPLRILDSKNPALKECIDGAPNLIDHIDSESKAHFDELKKLLDAAGVKYTINPHLVRGLDYYNRTVFEWVTTELGAQGTVCAGGRYDGLVEQLGGKPTPAVGFALGLERLAELYITAQQKTAAPFVDIYLISDGDVASEQCLLLAEKLHAEVPEINLLFDCVGGSFKSQFKRADKSNARLALIMGNDEVETNTVSIKFLREDKEQQKVEIGKLSEFIKNVVR